MSFKGGAPCCVVLSAVPCEAEERVPLPEGLSLVEDFVSSEEEAALLAAVDWSSTSDDVTGKLQPYFTCSLHVFDFCLPFVLFVFVAQKALKHRRVKHYGYEFRYDTNNVDKGKPLSVGKCCSSNHTFFPSAHHNVVLYYATSH